MKYQTITKLSYSFHVALFTRAWIEIDIKSGKYMTTAVALFTRAWIEISRTSEDFKGVRVALFTRAWIEIILYGIKYLKYNGRPLHEGVD